jgi:flagellar biosynthetic protein FliQ
MMMTLILAAPFLLVSLIIGVTISIFQAATSISEVTLTFIPKIVGVGLVLILLGSWMAQQMISFTVNLFNTLPSLPR